MHALILKIPQEKEELIGHQVTYKISSYNQKNKRTPSQTQGPN